MYGRQYNNEEIRRKVQENILAVAEEEQRDNQWILFGWQIHDLAACKTSGVAKVGGGTLSLS